METWPAVTDVETLRGISRLPSAVLSRDELASLTDTLVVPWFETAPGIAVFDKMRTHPRLCSGTGWITGISETRWDYSGSGQHRAYASSQPSDDAWAVLMTRHVSPYEIAREVPFQKYVASPAGLAALDNGVVLEQGMPRLGPRHPTIVYRYPSRNDDARTVVAAALPDRGFVPSTGYAHTIRHPEGTSGDDVLALLGYLNTRVCDWWARRLVDRHVTAPVINGLPLPEWEAGQVAEVAVIVTALLARAGVERLAGGIAFVESVSTQGRSVDDLYVQLDRMAFEGFQLTRAEVAVVLDDFSDRGLGSDIREALLALPSGDA
jgi:hypothetical protein